MTDQVIYQGNNLDLLARLPDCSVDAVVTDPPYGLAGPDQVKRAINRVAKVFEHRSLPDLYDWDLQAEQEPALPGVGDRGAPLGGGCGSVGVDVRVRVPESTVDLDRDAADHEVDARPEAPRPGVSQGDLTGEGDTPAGQFLGDYIFHPGHGAEGACDVLRGGLPELFLGGFSVPVVAALPAGLPGARAALSEDGGVDWFPVVGLGADALGQSGGPPGIVAGAGAVLRAVLRFDTGGAPRELGPAPSTSDEVYGDTARPNLVRARSGAGRLATMAKPFRVCLIGALADGTDAFFHLWLPFKLPVAKLPRGGFMGKDWDAALPDPQTWAECLRVLKPGGHLVAFGAPRLYHRLACQIEDAGFEMRDCLLWLFGSGFPKSLDVSKAIDKVRDDTAEVRVVCRWLRERMESCGATSKSVADHFGYHSRMVDHWAARDTDSQPNLPTLEQWDELRAYLGLPEDMDAEVLRLNLRKGQPGEAWEGRPVTGTVAEWTDRVNYTLTSRDGLARDTPITPAAQQWSGWGTALKPAYEPIVLARKPLDGTVAQTVQTWGTGAINVDGCRVGTEGGGTKCTNRDEHGKCRGHKNAGQSTSGETFHGAEVDGPAGRWPANLILDEGAGAMLDAQTGTLSARGNKGPSTRGDYDATSYGVGRGGDCGGSMTYDKGGGASRFFYCPKASRTEREAGLDHLPPRVVHEAHGDAARQSPRAGAGRSGEPRRCHHPTVKPVELMRWLVRLVTPPGGIVLEPFAGSGTTLVACALEDRDAIGMELDPEYVTIGRARVAHARDSFESAKLTTGEFNEP